MTIGSPMLAIKSIPADHDTQIWDLGPTLCNIWIWHFIMSGILWLYQTQGLFIICAPDKDMTQDSHRDCSLTAGHEKKSFNLVKDHYPTLIVYFLTEYLSYYYFYSLRVFHISVSWWFFTGVWVTASFLKSPGLLSVFWPISTMQ